MTDYNHYRLREAKAKLAQLKRSDESPHGAMINIFGEIGRDKAVCVAGVRRTFEKYPDARTLELLIDSPGGDAIEAMRIYDLVRSFRGHISARVLGRCASAATRILLAASHREAIKTSRFVLHEAALPPKMVEGRWTSGMHEKAARLLKEFNFELARFYAQRTGIATAVFQAEMRNENPLNSDGALRLKLIHNILDSPPIMAASSHVQPIARPPLKWTADEMRRLAFSGMVNRPIGMTPLALRRVLYQTSSVR